MAVKKDAQVIKITQKDYDESLAMLCDKGENTVDFIALGCPHYTLEEIRDAALYIEGKKFAENVEFAIWTDYATREMAVQKRLLQDG